MTKNVSRQPVLTFERGNTFSKEGERRVNSKHSMCGRPTGYEWTEENPKRQISFYNNSRYSLSPAKAAGGALKAFSARLLRASISRRTEGGVGGGCGSGASFGRNAKAMAAVKESPDDLHFFGCHPTGFGDGRRWCGCLPCRQDKQASLCNAYPSMHVPDDERCNKTIGVICRECLVVS